MLLYVNFDNVLLSHISVCGMVGYGVIKLQNKRRRDIKAKKDIVKNGKAQDKLCESLPKLF